MSQPNLTTKQRKIISLVKLAKSSNIDYMKLYYNISGRYNSLDFNDKTAICNALQSEIKPLFEFLGFNIKLTRIKTKAK